MGAAERPGHPPGREREGGPVTCPDRLRLPTSPLLDAEVMSSLTERGGTVAGLYPAGIAALLPDPAAEVELRRQLGREIWAEAYGSGYRKGYERGARLLEAQWPAIVAPVLSGRPDHAEAARWRLHVCCRACRRGWHRHGCPDCTDRDRATFGNPHPGDHGGKVAE